MDRWTEIGFKRGAAWRKMDPRSTRFKPVFTQFSVQRSMGYNWRRRRRGLGGSISMTHLIRQVFGKAGKRRHQESLLCVTGRVVHMISKVLILGAVELMCLWKGGA